FDSAFANTGPQQLRRITLGDPKFQGTGLSVTATRSAAHGGDGFANVGKIDASGVNLGAVVVDGDLGGINAGNSIKVGTGLAALTVQTLGRFGLTTGATEATSVVVGNVGTLVVHSDLVGVELNALSASSGLGGKIGSVSIGGSVLGGPAANGGILASGD